MNAPGLHAPDSLLADHDELHRALARLSAEPGPLGALAGEVEVLLLAHAAREEALALPLLALLPALAAGEMPPDAARVVAIARDLSREMPQFLDEHIAIVGRLARLLEMGQEIDRPDAVAVASSVIRHAELEEQVLYPAAILAGEIITARLLADAERPL
jgi:hypothetical protein